MRKTLLTCVAILSCFAVPAQAQTQLQKEAEIRQAVPYSRMLREFPEMTWLEYSNAVRELAKQQLRQEQTGLLRTQPRAYTPPPVPSTPRYTYTAPADIPPIDTPAPVYQPRSGTSYDWQSGNSYSWRKNYNGDTKVNGFNLNTGSMWQTTIKPDGSMRGTDSNMNPWTYDAKSKTYMNYGTGKICTGEGYGRVCF
jgi:hypothetical protein